MIDQGTNEKPLLTIDMVSDPVCPWCYIGKRSLDRAVMALSFEYNVMRRFRPYQLRADTPMEGVDRHAHYKKMFPDETQMRQVMDGMAESARLAGVNFDPMTPEILPNTIHAHRMIRLAHFDDKQDEMVEALFEAYWVKGADIGDIDVLSKFAGVMGKTVPDVKAYLEGKEDLAEIQDEANEFRNGGVSGVPTFIINEQTGFAGALPPDQLLNAIRQCTST